MKKLIFLFYLIGFISCNHDANRGFVWSHESSDGNYLVSVDSLNRIQINGDTLEALLILQKNGFLKCHRKKCDSIQKVYDKAWIGHICPHDTFLWTHDLENKSWKQSLERSGFVDSSGFLIQRDDENKNAFYVEGMGHQSEPAWVGGTILNRDSLGTVDNSDMIIIRDSSSKLFFEQGPPSGGKNYSSHYSVPVASHFHEPEPENGDMVIIRDPAMEDSFLIDLKTTFQTGPAIRINKHTRK